MDATQDAFSNWLKTCLREKNSNRIITILNEHFNERDTAVLSSDLQDDAVLLCGIFPDCKPEDITFILSIIGNEDNRLRIATRYLLKTKSTFPLKRNGDIVEDQVERKRSRTSTENVQTLAESKEGDKHNSHKKSDPLSVVKEIESTEQNIQTESVIGEYSSTATFKCATSQNIQNESSVDHSFNMAIQIPNEMYTNDRLNCDYPIVVKKDVLLDKDGVISDSALNTNSQNVDFTNELFDFSTCIDIATVDANNIQDPNFTKVCSEPNDSPENNKGMELNIGNCYLSTTCETVNQINSKVMDNVIIDFYNQGIRSELEHYENPMETNSNKPINTSETDILSGNSPKQEHKLDANVISNIEVKNEFLTESLNEVVTKSEKPDTVQFFEEQLLDFNSELLIPTKNLTLGGVVPKMKNLVDEKFEDSGNNILLSIISNVPVNETVTSTTQLNEMEPITHECTNDRLIFSTTSTTTPKAAVVLDSSNPLKLKIVRKSAESTITRATTVDSNLSQKASSIYSMLNHISSDGKSCAVSSSASTSITKCESVLASYDMTSDNGVQNIYSKLKEMFPSIPLNDIKSVCGRYITGQTNISDAIMNIIISKLLDFDKKDAEKVKAGETAEVSYVSTSVSGDHLPFPSSLPSEAPRLDRDASPAIPSALDLLFAHLDGDNNDMEEVQEVIEDEEDEKNQLLEENNALVYSLMEMFPEACPQYLRKLCKGKSNQPGILNDLITLILNDDYPKRKKVKSPEHTMNADEQLIFLKELLPDADPTYLEIHCNGLIDKPNELKAFIANAVESKNYPTMKDYLRRQQISAQQRQYTSEFTVGKFLEVIPEPETFFKADAKLKMGIECEHYALAFFRNYFVKIPLTKIRQEFKKNQYNFLLTYKTLQTLPTVCEMKRKRAHSSMPEAIQNIPLLQQIAYIEHKDEIEKYLEEIKLKEQEEFNKAKDSGVLQTCSCCYDDEVMPKNVYSCDKGCTFCKDCVKRGTEVAFGEGKLDFKCLNDCPSNFSLQTLQAVLNPKMFSKIAQKKQLEEVKAAGIEDLEMCPFCDFASIPAKEDKLFRCLNPDCMKESCRLCKEPSHMPLRCDEVEKENDVKMRTFIENKMTEALLRTCYKCGKKFIKSDGCNKMTCTCGATMCYVCKQPVRDYKHFNGQGGDRHDLCPLYSDTNQLHQQQVLQGAQDAKQEIGLDDASKLKIDPTADLKKHYSKGSKRKSVAAPFYINPLMQMNAEAVDQQQRILARLEEMRNMREQGLQVIAGLNRLGEDILQRRRQRNHHRHLHQNHHQHPME